MPAGIAAPDSPVVDEASEPAVDDDRTIDLIADFLEHRNKTWMHHNLAAMMTREFMPTEILCKIAHLLPLFLHYLWTFLSPFSS
jgi:hypothetical protein